MGHTNKYTMSDFKKNKKNANKGKGLITFADINDSLECPFKNDKERLRYMKDNYSHMSIAEQFAVFYGTKVNNEIKRDKAVNNPVVIEIGGTYKGKVRDMSKNGITFDVSGVKEEVVSKENFMDCYDHVKNYLLNHENELVFTVTDKRDNRYIVSVLEGYYRVWQKQIEKAIDQRLGIDVHIDSLVRGGYMCHTNIFTISELTGKEYTSAVFIPGSNIVLNIETDFERWLGKDVLAVPQKFTKFRSFGKPTENSLMASRKMVLKQIGNQNMYDIYMRAELAKNPNVTYVPEVFSGKVTGIINSNKKSGVFIELEDKCITGLMPIDDALLLNYKPGDYVDVYVSEFECMEGKEPFVMDKKNVIRQCNLRPVFALAV